MVSRRLIKFKIHELESQFDAKRGDQAFLRQLLDELKYRKTKRARELCKRAVQALAISPKDQTVNSAPQTQKSAPPIPHASPQAAVTATPRMEVAPKRVVPATPRKPTNLSGLGEPERVMLAWTAFEVLSPQSFLKPENLVSGEAYRISLFDNRGLPWENGGERSRPNYRLYYQVVLGTVQMEPAIAELLTLYTDRRDERPPARGESVLAIAILDREGRLVDSGAVAVSSFAWGVPIALKGDLKALGNWQTAEAELLEALDQQLRRYDNEG